MMREYIVYVAALAFLLAGAPFAYFDKNNVSAAFWIAGGLIFVLFPHAASDAHNNCAMTSRVFGVMGCSSPRTFMFGGVAILGVALFWLTD